jgi:hypothetical protein
MCFLSRAVVFRGTTVILKSHESDLNTKNLL